MLKLKEISPTLTSEIILLLCPWLWAYNKVWASGVCSQYGFLEKLSRETLCQEVDPKLDSFGVILFCKSRGISHVKIGHSYEAGVEGKTLAQKIVSVLWPIDPEDFIESLVLCTSGSEDRTYCYHIYRETTSQKDLLSTILKAAGEFKPSWAN